MKKVILLIFFAVVIAVFGYIVILQKDSRKIKTDTEEKIVKVESVENTVRLRGVITNVHTGCWADGTCSIEVDNNWWIQIIEGGLGPPDSKPVARGEVVGIVFDESNELIGKKVEVYAEKADQSSLTIFGSKEYYVRIIEE